MKKYYLSIILLATFLASVAQTKSNNIYLEGLGNAVVYSINYDRLFHISNELTIAPRVGFEYIPRRDVDAYGRYTFPTEINFLYNKNKNNPNHIEAGAGLTFFSLFDNYQYSVTNEIVGKNYKLAKISTLRLGFRHQKNEGGLMYRAGILVRLTQDDFSRSRVGGDLFYRIWPGFSIGYTF
ncbi:hypothetical protein [Pedobacter miscanthi]|jgi:hypothetical protein|uniref:hypothetical protein n=1 Tax=Pedobacter miscanthi TaxID=2259170 RepID=UPI00292DAA76|nr:hypothetical protein [Pedobacter miscanthi]